MFTNKLTLALLTFLLSLLYAILRYNVAGNVPWSELPVFILNKAVSLTALAFFAFSYRAGRTSWIPADSARYFGIFGFALMNLHLALTLIVWDPTHFAKLFEAGAPKPGTHLSMLLASIAVFAFCGPMWATAMDPAWSHWLRFQRAGYLGLLLTAAHVSAIGFAGWWTPSTWPAWLPPITLLSACIALWPLLRRRLN